MMVSLVSIELQETIACCDLLGSQYVDISLRLIRKTHCHPLVVMVRCEVLVSAQQLGQSDVETLLMVDL